jgi:tRNA threonylcarbamoyladenosine biosynthesis protein TsaE
MQEEFVYSLGSLDALVEILFMKMPFYKVFTLTGPLGAGKTTLVKKLLARCGIVDLVTSPTFTYMVAYSNENHQLFYHFDLYRISTKEEFLSAGFDEYLSVPNSWSFIEWPEVIMPLLRHDVCNIALDYVSQDERICRIIVGD